MIEDLVNVPPLYSNEDLPPSDVKVHIKLFTPDSIWTWYITEFDGEDLCFGYVVGHFEELGYFRLSEIFLINGPLGLPVERDEHFTANLDEVMKGEKR